MNTAELRLRKISIVVERRTLDPICDPGKREHPPCFETLTAYRSWMETVPEAPPLSRRDFVGEPNYCNDCTPEFKRSMTDVGSCLFPETRFRMQRTNELPGQPSEFELIGYTPRSRRLLNKSAALAIWHERKTRDESSELETPPNSTSTG